jgi:ribosomal-protein-alanine N-acetyltransferase
MINPLPALNLAPAALADIDAIDRIEREAFNTPWSRDLLRAAILNAQYRVQILSAPGEGVVGFYIAHTVNEKSNLDNLAVGAHVRGNGYGRTLVTDWIERARADRLESLTLQVNTANRLAQRLYEAFAFRTIRLLVSYYPNGEDAYQMERRLAPLPEQRTAPPEFGRSWFIPRRRRSGPRP